MKSTIHEFLSKETISSMGKTLVFLTIASSLFLTSCDDEDDFYNEKYVDIPNLVQVVPQNVYQVGDFMYIAADFSRFQTEPGFSTPLDIYQTTNGAPGFVFSYTFEREVAAGQWEPVTTTVQDMAIVEGSVRAGSFVLGTAEYDATDESYEYYVGYPLTTAGNYRISFGVNSDSNTEIELRSETQGNNLFLNIISDTNQLNSGGYYEFTVTP